MVGKQGFDGECEAAHNILNRAWICSKCPDHSRPYELGRASKFDVFVMKVASHLCW